MDLDRIDQEVRKLMHWRDSMTGPTVDAPLSSSSPTAPELDAAFARVEGLLKEFGDALTQVDLRLNTIETRLNELAALIPAPASEPPVPPAPEPA